MCGLVGIMGEPSVEMNNLFFDMLQFDHIRGIDSTGVATVDTKYATTTWRALGKSHNLFDVKGFGHQIPFRGNEGKNIVLLGHNRAATRGVKTVENAHPFIFNHIILAHNGTLHSTVDLLRPEGKWFDVDSKSIAYSIKEQGIELTWKEIDGGTALSWWDMKQESMFFIRNDKRPLYYAFTKDTKHFIWASEEWMIKFNAHRRGFKIKNIISLPIHKLLQVKIEDGKVKGTISKNELEFKEPTVKKSVVNTGNYGRTYGVNNQYYGYNRNQNASVYELHNNKRNEKDTPKEDTKKVITSLSDLSTPKEGVLEELYIKRHKFCLFCKEDITPDWQNSYEVTSTTVLCGSCHDFLDVSDMAEKRDIIGLANMFG